MNSHHTKYQIVDEGQECEGIFSTTNPDTPQTKFHRQGEDKSLIRDEPMTSAHVDSFFLPGGIFELEEEKVDNEFPSQDFYQKTRGEYYSTAIHPPRPTYEFNQAPIGSHPTHGSDYFDQRINSYHVASDEGLRSSLHALSDHLTTSAVDSNSSHRQLLFESRQSHFPKRIDFFQHSIDPPVLSDQMPGPGTSNKYGGYAPHIPGDSNNRSANNLFRMTQNQDMSQPSLLSSSLLISKDGQQPLMMGEESRLYPNIQYQTKNWRDYGSPVLPQDNTVNYNSTGRSGQSNNPVFVPSNPWRNYGVAHQAPMQVANPLGQRFQFVGHSPSDQADYFNNNGGPNLPNTVPLKPPSHLPAIYTDPRIHGPNMMYSKSPTDQSEYTISGVQCLSNNTSWQPPAHVPILVTDTRNHVNSAAYNVSADQSEYISDCGVPMLSSHASRPVPSQIPLVLTDTGNHGPNVSYNKASAAFIGTPNMSATTSTSTVGNSARAPPGFPSSQSYHPTLTLASGAGTPVTYGQSNEAPTLMVRKINSFHALDAQDASNKIKMSDDGQDIPRVMADPNLQKIYRNEQDKRHRRDRDLDSQSSRGGVPSTIYLRTDDDEDGISFSEDTLTACADSIAEYDREYFRKTAMNKKDRNHMENTKQLIKDGEYAQAPRISIQSADYERDKKIHYDEGHNTENELEEEEEEEEELNYIPDRRNETPRINCSTEEPMKKPKRKKKKVKKISTESVSSREFSHEIAPSANESLVIPEASAEETRVIVKMEPVTELPGIISESMNTRSDKFRHPKGTKMKISQSHQYLTRQQKVNGLVEDSTLTPKASLMRKSLTDFYREYSHMILPLLQNSFNILNASALTLVKVIIHGASLLLPSWERLWFILPVFCFISDLLFSLFCIISSCLGKLSYVLLLAHKLAIAEISENLTVVMCYSITSSVPILAGHILRLFPSLPSGSILVLWYTIVRVLLSPMDIGQTFLARVSIDSESRFAQIKRMSSRDQGIFASTVTSNLLESSKENDVKMEESERLHLTNQFLSTLRSMIPLFVLIECLSTGHGFIVGMSLSERILLGFGLSVIKMGYIFVPVIFISWTLQLLLILLFPNRTWQMYSLLLVGFSTIRLSHHSSASEDMKIKFV